MPVVAVEEAARLPLPTQRTPEGPEGRPTRIQQAVVEPEVLSTAALGPQVRRSVKAAVVAARRTRVQVARVGTELPQPVVVVVVREP
jgi:hypothetical protein